MSRESVFIPDNPMPAGIFGNASEASLAVSKR